MRKEKLCIAMVASGKQYLSYIPMFVYFCKKAYPEYAIKFFCKEQFPDNLKQQMKLLKSELGKIMNNVEVYDNSFAGYSDNSNIVKTLRWTLGDEGFENYENVFIGDVDILITREDKSLLDQHLEECEKKNRPYSNTTLNDHPKTRGYRMTGSHFFKREPYLESMKGIMMHYRRELKVGFPYEFYNNVTKKQDNQHALYEMIKQSGLPLPQIGKEDMFFNYHGIHLGHSRCPGRWNRIFDDEPIHRTFYKEFRPLTSNALFVSLYNQLPPVIKNEINLVIKSGDKLC